MWHQRAWLQGIRVSIWGNLALGIVTWCGESLCHDAGLRACLTGYLPICVVSISTGPGLLLLVIVGHPKVAT
jgi:hypothetical protein